MTIIVSGVILLTVMLAGAMVIIVARARGRMTRRRADYLLLLIGAAVGLGLLGILVFPR